MSNYREQRIGRWLFGFHRYPAFSWRKGYTFKIERRRDFEFPTGPALVIIGRWGNCQLNITRSRKPKGVAV